MPKNAPTPFISGYHPELDIAPEMDAKESAYYQSLIVILKWIIELGTFKTSLIASCMDMPRCGHLEQLCQCTSVAFAVRLVRSTSRFCQAYTIALAIAYSVDITVEANIVPRGKH